MLTKECKDVNIIEITSGNYAVPKGEEKIYHVKIEVKKFNANTGERQSKPRIQKFGIKTYETTVRADLIRQGYTLDVLHNPNDWMKANAEAIKKAAEEKAAASAKAAEEKAAADAKAAEKAKADEKAALKAEILAELKASGVIPTATETKTADAKTETTTKTSK